MDTHYICKGGCGGISLNPGICGAFDCADNGHDLHECACDDGLHSSLADLTKKSEVKKVDDDEEEEDVGHNL
jgi:hypothetical protein